jgi:phosphoribosylaminoimidazole carboxylase (NCAIR synthetase)
MGYQVAVLEPSDACPAGQVAQRLVNAGYSDAAGLDALAAQCAAVTTEFENVPADSLSRLAQRCSWRPTRMACRWRRTASPRSASSSLRASPACCRRRTR